MKKRTSFERGGLTRSSTRPSGNNYQPLETTPEEPEDNRSFFERMKSDFSRIKAGNIDDPSSEAYKKYGAVRSSAMPSVSSEEDNPRPQFTRREPVILPYKPSEETMKRNTSGMDVQDESGMVNKRLKRNPDTGELYDTEVSAPSVKPTASKPAASKTESKITSTPKAPAYVQRYTEEMMEADNPSVKAEKAPAAKPKPSAEAPSAPKTSSSRVPTSEQAAANRAAAAEKVKGMGSSIADYFSTYETPAERRNKERKEKAAKGYSSGGSVSSASRRADGIATKGKTRGRMC
jgi:hypothetical protein